MLLIPNFDNVEGIRYETGDAAAYSSSETFRENNNGATAAFVVAAAAVSSYSHYRLILNNATNTPLLDPYL